MKFNFNYFKTFSGIFKVVEWVKAYNRSSVDFAKLNVGAAHHFDPDNQIWRCDLPCGKY